MRVVGIGGSLDGGKSTRQAMLAILAAAEQAGACVRAFDLAAIDMPTYVHGMDVPEQIAEFVSEVHAAHGLVWATPLYHGSVSGAFKNAIDWLELLRTREPAYLTDKVVALTCCAGGAQAMQGINAMEPMVRSLRGLTLPLVAPIERAWQAFDPSGAPTDPAMARTLNLMGSELVRVAGLIHRARAPGP